jgi:hypothetical protein
MKIVQYPIFEVRIYDTSIEPERLLFGEDTHLGIATMMIQKFQKEDAARSIRVEMKSLNKKMSVAVQ